MLMTVSGQWFSIASSLCSNSKNKKKKEKEPVIVFDAVSNTSAQKYTDSSKNNYTGREHQMMRIKFAQGIQIIMSKLNHSSQLMFYFSLFLHQISLPSGYSHHN